METLAVHKSQESTAHEDQRSLVVALGAGNLSRGLSRLLQAARSCSSSAFDLVVAAGQSVYVTQQMRQGTAQWSAWKEWSRLCAASAETRSLAGVMLFTPQQILQLGDTTRVFLLKRSHVLEHQDYSFICENTTTFLLSRFE